MPLKRDAALVAVATIGTTLAPWGLAFIQSYAADKKLPIDELRSWLTALALALVAAAIATLAALTLL